MLSVRPPWIRSSRGKPLRKLRTLGDAARDARNWPLAASLYEAYLSTPPFERDAAIWVQLGHARKETGDKEGAMRAYLRAQELDAGVADTHLQVGYLHLAMGDRSRAAASLAQALRLDATLEHVRHDLAALDEAPIAAPKRDLEAGGSGGGKGADHGGVRADDVTGPDRAARLLAAADSARDDRRWLEAAERYAAHLDLLADHEDSWPIWVQLGHARKEAGDKEGARRAYERAVELAPTDAETHLHLGHLHKNTGNLDAAMDAFETALQHVPRMAEARQEMQALASRLQRQPDQDGASGRHGSLRVAEPPPHPPGHATFDPVFPPIYAGLSRRFAR